MKMQSKASSMKFGASILLLLLCVHGFLVSESFAFNNADRSLSVPSRIQSRSIASSVSSFRSVPLVLRTHRNAVQFDDQVSCLTFSSDIPLLSFSRVTRRVIAVGGRELKLHRLFVREL